MSVSRPTNPLLATAPLIVAGVFVVCAIAAAIYLAPRIERKGTAKRDQAKLLGSVGKVRKSGEISSLDTRITMIDSQIRTSDALTNSDVRSNEGLKKLGLPQPPILSSPDGQKEKDDLIGRRAELVRQRDALKAEFDQPIKVEPWYRPYLNFEFISSAVLLLVFGWLGLTLIRLGLAGRLPDRNLFALTDGERRNIALAAGVIALTLSLFVGLGTILSAS